jgi:hypothetical protein
MERATERERIKDIWGGDGAGIMALMERQFGVLHNRAQVLLGLCGIVISATGFSGRIVAGTNRLAQGLIVTGVCGVLVAAVLAGWGVLHVRWLTQQPGATLDEWLTVALGYRDRKTAYYRFALAALLLGLAFYVGAISVMLTNPLDGGLPAR